MVRHRFSQIRPLAVLTDAIALVIAFLGAVLLRREVLLFFLAEESQQDWQRYLLEFFYKGYEFTTLPGELPLEFDFSLMLLMGGIWLVALKVKGAYEDHILNSHPELLR